MLVYRGYRKFRALLKAYLYKIIYTRVLKGPLFSIGKGGDLLIIGNDSLLNIGKNNVIRNNVSIRVTGGKLYFGDNLFINDNFCLVSRGKITIGNDCLIGQNVCIYDNNHNFNKELPINKQGFTISEVIIGNNVWIASNVVILPGVNIGDNVVIGAGTVVTKDIPNNSIYYNQIISKLKNNDKESITIN